MRILICDDDAESANRCQRLLKEISERHGASAEIQTVNSGRQLLFFIDSKYAKTDLIYMDIHMPDMSGMETARKLRGLGLNMDIIFYTEDETMAAEAFDVEALHYIVKTKVSKQKFEQIFLRAMERSEQRNSELIMLSCAGEHIQISISKIQYFEVRNRIVTVFYESRAGNQEKFEFYSSLAKLQEFLLGKDFLRIHCSYLVNEKYIVKKTSKEVVMMSGEHLPVGRAYAVNMK